MKSKKGLYRITDEFFQFWFKFIFPRRGELEMERIDNVLNGVKEGMPQTFPLFMKKLLLRCSGDILWTGFFPFASIGRWWDKNEKIDIVGINKELNSILFGEVKWTAKPVGTDIYEALKLKIQKVEWGKKGRKNFFCLFSKKGFTEAMLKMAKKEGVVLFKEDMALKI